MSGKPKSLDELRKRVIDERDWAVKAARIDNAADECLLNQHDYDAILADVKEIGLMALQLERSDIYELCSANEFLHPEEEAVLLTKVLKMLEEPTAPEPDYLSIQQVAARASLSPTKVRREVIAGRLPAANKGSKRRPLYRIAKDELDTLMRQEGASLPSKKKVAPWSIATSPDACGRLRRWRCGPADGRRANTAASW
jgi:excisionase family DNA binding protein